MAELNPSPSDPTDSEAGAEPEDAGHGRGHSAPDRAPDIELAERERDRARRRIWELEREVEHAWRALHEIEARVRRVRRAAGGPGGPPAPGP